MKNRFKFLLASLGLFSPLMGLAQDAEMADQMRAEGKIYVVVAVILIIFAGLVAYLILIDRKVSKLEKNLRNSK